jgi:hypothetical protein
VHDLAQTRENAKSSDAVLIEEVYSWAGKLASESRVEEWTDYWYVTPEAVQRLIRRLESSNDLLIGLVGLQGVGKSAALQAILKHRYGEELIAYRKACERPKGSLPNLEDGTILFKWRRPQELFAALLNDTHELSRDFYFAYTEALSSKLNWRLHQSNRVQGTGSIDESERLLSRSEAKQLRQVTWLEMLTKKNTILIDTLITQRPIDDQWPRT